MPYILKKYHPWRNILFIIGEGLLIFLVINALFLLWIGYGTYREMFSLFVFRAIVAALVFQLCFYYFDLYDQSVIPGFSDHMLEVLQAFGFGCIALALIYYIFPFLTISNLYIRTL